MSSNNVPEISLSAEPIFNIGSFTVTNTVIMSTLALVLLLILGVSLRRKLAIVPGKLQGIFELAIESLLDLMESVLGNRFAAQRYLPLIATIFIFVLFSNWLGLLPGVGSLVIYENGRSIPVLRSPSADLNFTLALAICAVIAVNVIGVSAVGAARHSKKFLNFKNPVFFGVGLLEFISEFARMVSFSFRLFGNIFAGEVLLTIIAFLVPYVIPLPFLFLEIFVGFIQAFIFSMLTLVFIAGAVAEHEH